MHSGHPRVAARWVTGLAAALVLAANALADGGFLTPVRRQPLEAGSTVDVRWTLPCEDRPEATETELVMSLDGGRTFSIRVTAEMAPCATRFRWKVPALPAAHARLALRSGAGEGSETERLDLVSEEFQIVAVVGEEPEELVRGATELWTRQALTDLSAGDLLSTSMRGEAERLVVPGFLPDISEPTPAGVLAPGVSKASLPAGGGRYRPVSLRPHAPGPASPTPLRL